MFRDAGHADYQALNMDQVKKRALLLADSNEPTIPKGLAQVLDEEEGLMSEQMHTGVDKAATPAERHLSAQALVKSLDRTRPLLLFAQRDSGAKK